MGVPKRHSPLDEPLARAASELAGFEITRTQVEDWREKGILEVARSGDRPGRYSYEYVPGTDALAACIGTILKEDRDRRLVPNLDEAVLVCFVRGHRPKEIGLRRAYERMFIGMGVGPEGARLTPRDAAKASRRASRAPVLRALKQQVERPSDLPSVLENMAEAAFGFSTTLKPQTIAATFGLFGATPEVIEAVLRDPSPPPSIISHAEAIRTASMDELEAARDLATIWADALRRTVEPMARDLGFRFSVPEGLPEVWSEVVTAVLWLPHIVRRRRIHGVKEFDATIRGLPAAIAAEFPEADATEGP